jgi:hypothetical protein
MNDRSYKNTHLKSPLAKDVYGFNVVDGKLTPRLWMKDACFTVQSKPVSTSCDPAQLNGLHVIHWRVDSLINLRYCLLVKYLDHSKQTAKTLSHWNLISFM